MEYKLIYPYLVNTKRPFILKYLIGILILFSSMTTAIIFDFNKNSDLKNWNIVDDVVMGGKSSGTFTLNNKGQGVFEGAISLENNGGFSSLRYRLGKTPIQEATAIVLKLKGDGKAYQFRIKSNAMNAYSYVSVFQTSGDWQEIHIQLKDMYPAFRGRKLNQPNFEKESIEEIAFLFGNKKQERFKLLLDKIELQ
jgi:NADH dehydrogenase [ubiquinone] 1 alpha subcomplex assembly factor 1